MQILNPSQRDDPFTWFYQKFRPFIRIHEGEKSLKGSIHDLIEDDANYFFSHAWEFITTWLTEDRKMFI